MDTAVISTSFSAGSIGYLLRTVVKTWNERASKYLYWTIFGLCSTCLVVAGAISTIKLISKPTGSEIDLQPFDEIIHKATVSVCKIFETLDQYTDTIPALESVSYEKNSNVTREWLEEDDTEASLFFLGK